MRETEGDRGRENIVCCPTDVDFVQLQRSYIGRRVSLWDRRHVDGGRGLSSSFDR